MAKQVAKIKLTGRLAKNHLTALERNQLTLTEQLWKVEFAEIPKEVV